MIAPDQPDTAPTTFTEAEIRELPAGARVYRWDARTGDRLYFTRQPGGLVLDGTTTVLVPAALAAFAPVPAPAPLVRLAAWDGWETFEGRPGPASSWSLHLIGRSHVTVRLERDTEGHLVVLEAGLEPRSLEGVPTWARLPAELPDALEDLIEDQAWALGQAHREDDPPTDETPNGHRIAWWSAQVATPKALAAILAVLPWDAARSAYLLGLYGKPRPSDCQEDPLERARRLVG